MYVPNWTMIWIEKTIILIIKMIQERTNRDGDGDADANYSNIENN